MRNTLESFSYDGLDPGTRKFVQERTDEIKKLVRRTAHDCVQLGLYFREVKERLNHGEWLAWVRCEVELGERLVQNFMNVARNFKPETISDLPIDATALYLLAAPSTPESAQVEAIDRAKSEERITPVVAREIIGSHRAAQEVTEDDLIIDVDIDPRLSTPHPQKDINAFDGVPESVRSLVQRGVIGWPIAQAISKQIEVAPESVHKVVENWGVRDPEIIPILARLARNGSDTFNVISITGHIPHPDESIPIGDASGRELQNYLDLASREHRLMGVAAKKEREQERLQEKIDELRGDNVEFLVTDELGDLAGVSDECLVLYMPGKQSASELGELISKWELRHLAVLLFKGDPPVNLDGKIIPASAACYRIPGPARRFVEELCSVSQSESIHAS